MAEHNCNFCRFWRSHDDCDPIETTETAEAVQAWADEQTWDDDDLPAQAADGCPAFRARADGRHVLEALKDATEGRR